MCLTVLDPDGGGIVRWMDVFQHGPKICLEFELLDKSLSRKSSTFCLWIKSRSSWNRCGWTSTSTIFTIIFDNLRFSKQKQEAVQGQGCWMCCSPAHPALSIHQHCNQSAAGFSYSWIDNEDISRPDSDQVQNDTGWSAVGHRLCVQVQLISPHTGDDTEDHRGRWFKFCCQAQPLKQIEWLNTVNIYLLAPDLLFS